jgi:hypothetical protein
VTVVEMTDLGILVDYCLARAWRESQGRASGSDPISFWLDICVYYLPVHI